MKVKIANIFLLLAFIALTGFSNETPQNQPHQIYFGPEVANVSVDTHIKNVHVHGSKSFWGLRLGYEFINPWSFYAGVDYLSMITSQHFQAKQEGKDIHSSSQDNVFGNLDLRFGYTTTLNKTVLIPFAGTGLYALGSAPRNRGFQEGWLYVSTGLRSTFPINAAFRIGLNVKLLKSILAYKEFRNHNVKVSSHSFPWGIEAGVPFIWNFNPRGTWKFQLEPYWIKLDFSEKQNIFGSKFLIKAKF